MFHLSKKILIGISLVLSFGITMALSTILTPPFPRLGNILAALEKIQNYKINFQLPKMSLPKIFTQVTTSTNHQSPVTNNPVVFSKTTPAPNRPQPTVPSQNYPSATTIPLTNAPYPTTTQPPVNTPKPTKTPKPTPTPTFALTNPRPGNNIREVAEIVGNILCAPPAMIYAIYDNEAGYLGPQVNSNWTYYNTYQGSDPTDVSGSTGVYGVTQMMGDTWHRIKPYVAQKLGTSELSLEVTFDSMAAAAFHVRNVSLAGTDHQPCDDWPVKYILYGACRYNGACPANTMGQTQYYNTYTYSVCESYNEYGAKQKNCQ